MQKRWIKIKPVGEYSSPHWLFHIQRRCFSHIVDVRYFVIGLSRKSEPKRIIISASDASSLLCVTTITHFFSLWAISFRISITSQAVASSRLPVGSSAKRTFASLAKARAMATRCCWPPDNWRTLRFQYSLPIPSCVKRAWGFPLPPSLTFSTGVK